MPGPRSRGAAAERVAKAAARWRAAVPGVLVTAIDGPGGAGKSTIAAAAAAQLGAVLLHTDDFFRPADDHPAGDRPADRRPAAGSPVADRPADRSTAAGTTGPAGRALREYYDWPRLRAEALIPLRAGQPATFRRLDWACGRLGGASTVAPGPLVVLEGVLSAAPELADLVHKSVLVETPEDERLRRLRQRVRPEDWDEVWLAAERVYFRRIRPAVSFDLIVPGARPWPAAGR